MNALGSVSFFLNYLYERQTHMKYVFILNTVNDIHPDTGINATKQIED